MVERTKTEVHPHHRREGLGLFSAAPRNGTVQTVGFNHSAAKEAYFKTCPTPTAERTSLEFFLRIKITSMNTVLLGKPAPERWRHHSQSPHIPANTARTPPLEDTVRGSLQGILLAVLSSTLQTTPAIPRISQRHTHTKLIPTVTGQAGRKQAQRQELRLLGE